MWVIKARQDDLWIGPGWGGSWRWTDHSDLAFVFITRKELMEALHSLPFPEGLDIVFIRREIETH